MALPEVKKVVVAYGNKIVMRDSLSEAINAIFNLGQGSDISESNKSESSTNAKESLEEKARDLLAKAKSAQAKGDTKAYNSYMTELEKVLNSLSNN